MVAKWRATADEDGHYCFAVALWCDSRLL